LQHGLAFRKSGHRNGRRRSWCTPPLVHLHFCEYLQSCSDAVLPPTPKSAKPRLRIGEITYALTFERRPAKSS
jgi:hypothetical protein